MDKQFEFLIGLEVEADHPITCVNPTKTFKIFDVQIDDGWSGKTIFVRGEDTMWFSTRMIKRVGK